MNQFNELYAVLLQEYSRGEMFDTLKLNQVGLVKRDYLKKPEKVPLSPPKEEEVIRCPHCNRDFVRQDVE